MNFKPVDVNSSVWSAPVISDIDSSVWLAVGSAVRSVVYLDVKEELQ